MERRDKIRVLTQLESGEISLEKFKEMTDSIDELEMMYYPQRLWQEYTEAWDSFDKELSDEERLKRMDDELLYKLIDCRYNQRPGYSYECINKHRDLEDENCQACEEARKLRQIKKNV